MSTNSYLEKRGEVWHLVSHTRKCFVVGRSTSASAVTVTTANAYARLLALVGLTTIDIAHSIYSEPSTEAVLLLKADF